MATGTISTEEALDVVETLVSRLVQRFPGLTIAGYRSPPFRPLTPEEDAADVQAINETRPDFVWVGLGMPKQEKWMLQHVGRIQAAALLGIGAAFDFAAGTKPRAPLWMQRCGFGVVIPSHDGASAAGSPLSRLQLDFCRARGTADYRVEILRSRLVSFGSFQCGRLSPGASTRARHCRMGRMKLLISAYACAPNRGSEHGIGWNWTTEARRLGHEVWALVSPAHRNAIEEASRDDAVCRSIHWLFPEVSYWPLQPAIEPKWERTYNLIWQRTASRMARELQRSVRFDAVHHLTWGGVRAPTFLGSLGPPLIVGPIGGGETSPFSLRDGFSFRSKILEALRDLSNSTISINPIVRRGLYDAAVIFAKTTDTRNMLSGTLREKTFVFGELGIRKVQIASPRTRRETPPMLLYAGRLLYWKGVHIAIQAFAKLLTKIPSARFTVVGNGPEETRLKADTLALGIDQNVDFISWLPQNELFDLYDSHDLLLFPSLHDSSGGVVLESLCHGMPVVCLDLGGPRDLVTPGSGVIIETGGRNTAEVAQQIADDIFRLIESPQRMSELSTGAVSRARDFLLRRRVKEFYDLAATFVPVASHGNSGPETYCDDDILS